MDFRTYFDHLFRRPQEQHAVYDLVRNFSNWFFDLLRNFVLVGALKYFYETSGSAVLFWLHEFALAVIFLYCLSYADQWYLNLFGFLENKRVAHWLNRAVNFSVAVALFFLIRWGASIVVSEISHAHGPAA